MPPHHPVGFGLFFFAIPTGFVRVAHSTPWLLYAASPYGEALKFRSPVGSPNFNLSLSPSNNNQGRLYFHAYSGGLTILKLLRFAKAVIHDSLSKKVVLIVDNLRIHHAKIVKAWAARHRDEIKIFYLPAYSPELNPDELVNGDLKPGVGQREPAANKEELRMQIFEHMEETKSNPEKEKNFFRKASVRYASNNHVLLPEQ